MYSKILFLLLQLLLAIQCVSAFLPLSSPRIKHVVKPLLMATRSENESLMREIRAVHMDIIRSWHALRCYERDMLASNDPTEIFRLTSLIAKEREEQQRLIQRKRTLVRGVIGFFSEFGDGRH